MRSATISLPDGQIYKLTSKDKSSPKLEYYNELNHTEGVKLVFDKDSTSECPYGQGREKYGLTVSLLCEPAAKIVEYSIA